MKKILTGLLTLVAAVLPLSACSGAENVNNMEAYGKIYVEGEQTVTLTGCTSAMGDAPAVFLSDVGTADVTLEGALAGKTVREVSFVSSDKITVVLAGDVTIAEDKAEGTIVVAARAVEGKDNSYCVTWVEKPCMSAGAHFSSGSSTNKKMISTFTLPYGAFTEFATTEYVTLVDDTNGRIASVVVNSDGSLKVTVENFDPSGEEAYPKVRFAAETTTFGVEIIARVGVFGTYLLK